jgi:hypothetical protein
MRANEKGFGQISGPGKGSLAEFFPSIKKGEWQEKSFRRSFGSQLKDSEGVKCHAGSLGLPGTMA